MTRLLRRVALLALLFFATTLAAESNGNRPPYDRALYPHWIKVEGGLYLDRQALDRFKA